MFAANFISKHTMNFISKYTTMHLIEIWPKWTLTDGYYTELSQIDMFELPLLGAQ